MNYCCEAYASLYVNECRYREWGRDDTHADWPHYRCDTYGPKRRIVEKYADLLLDEEGNLKPKSDTCPFCKLAQPTGTYPDMTGLEYVELEDVPEERCKGVTRHIAREPDWEVGAALIRRLHGHARS